MHLLRSRTARCPRFAPGPLALACALVGLAGAQPSQAFVPSYTGEVSYSRTLSVPGAPFFIETLRDSRLNSATTFTLSTHPSVLASVTSNSVVVRNSGLAAVTAPTRRETEEAGGSIQVRFNLGLDPVEAGTLATLSLDWNFANTIALTQNSNFFSRSDARLFGPVVAPPRTSFQPTRSCSEAARTSSSLTTQPSGTRGSRAPRSRPTWCCGGAAPTSSG